MRRLLAIAVLTITIALPAGASVVEFAMGGYTFSADFPLRLPLQAAMSGTSDAFLAILSPTAESLIASTYLGGSGLDSVRSVKRAASDDVLAFGFTSSPDFPVSNAIYPVFSGTSDGFVASFDASISSFRFSTFFGGSGADEINAGDLDPAGNIWLAGYSASDDLPIVRPLQAANSGDNDAFVAVTDNLGRSLQFSSYYGGSDIDGIRSITTAALGTAYTVGYSESPDFPTVSAYQPTFAGGLDAVVIKTALLHRAARGRRRRAHLPGWQRDA